MVRHKEIKKNNLILWFICFIFYVKQCLAQSSMALSTIPENQMTKNYVGLQAIADVSFEYIESCQIYFDGSSSVYFRNEEYVNIYSGFQAQYEYISNGTAIKIVVTTSRKYQSDISVVLRCDPYSGPSEELFLPITVVGCPTYLTSNIKVKFDGIADYQQKGNFQCNDSDATLIDLEGNLLTSTSTVCQSDTSWENQENVQCIYDALSQNWTLTTIPVNQTSWATNYAGIQAQVFVSFKYIYRCYLYFDGVQSVYFHYDGSVHMYASFHVRHDYLSNHAAITMVVTSPLKYQNDITLVLDCLKHSGIYENLQFSITVKDCPEFLPGNIKVDFSGKAEYQRSGNFECIDKDARLFDSAGNILNTTSTTCQSDATWENQGNIQCWKDAYKQQSITFHTIPEKQTIWATNYVGLQIQANVSFESIDYCWIDFGKEQAVSFNKDGGISINPGYKVKQDYHGSDIVIVVTSENKLQDDFSITLECYNPSGMYDTLYLAILPQDCPTRLPTNLVVNFDGIADHRRSGNFECFDTNAKLFNSSGNLLTTTSTVCQSDATWENQENFQCWKAAEVELVGNLQFTNEGTLSLQCMYINNGFPDGTTYTMFVGNEIYVLDKGQTHTQNVNWEDNNNEIYCQAETPFTQHFPESGKSLVKTIEVMFAPLLVSTEKIICEWLINEPGICLLKFRSNPNVDEVQLLFDGVTPVLSEAENNLTTDGDKHIFHFIKEMVTSLDHGNYILLLKTSTFEMVEVKFDINVHIPTDETPFIVGLSFISALLVISAGVNAYFIKTQLEKRKEKKNIEVEYSNNYSECTTRQAQLPQEINTENVYANNIQDNEEIYADIL